ncbi:MAG: metallophosphoesterase [Gemmataceae bacterium]|nr:metallophosphoesterase [Gemmataceae bacterium]
MVYLAHLSDIHITAPTLGWRLGDYFTKRWPGWINFRWLGRGHRFRHADEVLAALSVELRQRRPNRVIFSGDATSMGFEGEFQRAAEILGVTHPDMPPGLAVPGNHDYYTRAVAESGLFERYFGSWQHGERVDGATYPFAQRVGHVWLIGVNACTGNVWPWDAGGSVGAAQLDRLGRLLARLAPGPRILVTHYPVALASGRPERRTHGLRDVKQTVAVAAAGGVSLWLHGHRHEAYQLTFPAQAPFPVVCAGSATQCGLWSYTEYRIDGEQCQGLRRVWDPDRRAFRDGETFELRLGEGEPVGDSLRQRV